MESFEGTLESGDLIALLRKIHATGAVGLLSVQGDPDLVSVTFRSGRVVAADAMNRPAEEALSSLLASRGLLSPSEFEKAIAPYLGSGRPPGQALLEQGLVEREELLEAVRDQTYSQVLRLLRWETGNLSWNAGVESPHQEGMEPIGVPELLVRSVADLGIEAPLRQPLPNLDTRYRAASDDGRRVEVIGRAGDGLREDDERVIWLTPDEERVWRALVHRRPAAELTAATGLDRYDVIYALHRLEGAQLVFAETFGAPADDLSELTRDVGLDPVIHDSAEHSEVHDGQPFFDQLPSGGSLLGGEDETSWAEAPMVPMSALEEESPPSQQADFERPRGPQRPPTRSAMVTATATWVVRGIALGLVLLVFGLIATARERSSWLLPFPWLEGHRRSFERVQTLALYGEIDRAVRTYYLLFSRYPEELGILVDFELLRGNDLHDQRHRWMDFSSGQGGYVLQPMEGGRGVPGSELTAEIESDFLLNPKFIEPPSSGRQALVLLE